MPSPQKSDLKRGSRSAGSRESESRERQGDLAALSRLNEGYEELVAAVNEIAEATDFPVRSSELVTLARAATEAFERFRDPLAQALALPLDQAQDQLSSLSAAWSGYRLIDAGARIAARHPDLQGKASYLRSLLTWEASKSRMVHELAGGPRSVVTAAELEEELRVRIASEAIADIWQERVLEPGEVALALGAKKSNREKVSALRKRSWLLGLPRGHAYLYPAFQIDVSRREVYPEVREINEVLDAVEDPWGVASWWISTNDRLGGRPADLVGSPRAEDLVEAAKAVTAPIG